MGPKLEKMERPEEQSRAAPVAGANAGSALPGGTVESALEWLADNGYCPALVFDDNGLWAVTGAGSQGINLPPQDMGMSYFVQADQWKPSIRDAVAYFVAQNC